MKILNIVTPCSRPGNLKFLLKSIQKPDDTEVYWYIVYDYGVKPYVEMPETYGGINIIQNFALEKSFVGNSLRNLALNEIKTGLVYFLDDDNIFNPKFWAHFGLFQTNRFYSFLSKFTPAEPIVIRKFKNEWHLFLLGLHQTKKVTRSGVPTFKFAIQNYLELLKGVKDHEHCLYPCSPKVDHIDSSMCCIDRGLIGDSRFPENAYNADGIFLEEVFLKSKDNFVFIDDYLAYYNYLEKYIILDE